MRRVFTTIDALWTFCQLLTSEIPENLGEDEGSGDSKKIFLPQELGGPTRYAFKLQTTYSADEIEDLLCRLREDPSLEQDLSGFDLELGDSSGAVFHPPQYMS